MSSLAHFVLSAKFILALKRANLLTCVIRITGYYDFYHVVWPNSDPGAGVINNF